MASTHLLHGGSKLSGAQDGQMSTLSTSAELQRNCLSDWGGEAQPWCGKLAIVHAMGHPRYPWCGLCDRATGCGCDPRVCFSSMNAARAALPVPVRPHPSLRRRWAGTARTVYDGGVRRHSGTIGGVYSCIMLACVMFVLPHPACLVSVSLHPIDV